MKSRCSSLFLARSSSCVNSFCCLPFLFPLSCQLFFPYWHQIWQWTMGLVARFITILGLLAPGKAKRVSEHGLAACLIPLKLHAPQLLTHLSDFLSEHAPAVTASCVPSLFTTSVCGWTLTPLALFYYFYPCSQTSSSVQHKKSGRRSQIIVEIGITLLRLSYPRLLSYTSHWDDYEVVFSCFLDKCLL